jgi:hypothetical protein
MMQNKCSVLKLDRLEILNGDRRAATGACIEFYNMIWNMLTCPEVH